LRGNLTSYGAWYVALAEALDCPLVTLDRKLSRAGGPICEIIAPPRS
jgi:predicted nucleic acid-binding protein